MAGPFVSAMANRWGFRPITIAGSFVASAAFAVSSMSPNIPLLYFTYGVCGGIGFSMIYIPGELSFFLVFNSVYLLFRSSIAFYS